MGAINGTISDLKIDGNPYLKCDSVLFQKKLDSVRDKFANSLDRKLRELGKGFKTLSACATIVSVDANKLCDALAKEYPAPDIKIVSHSDPARNLVETTWFYRVPRKMKKKMRKECRNELFTTITMPSNIIEVTYAKN